MKTEITIYKINPADNLDTKYPEIAKRIAEIESTELDEEETRYALWVGKSIKWRKSQDANPSFKAGNDSLNVIEKKDLK